MKRRVGYLFFLWVLVFLASCSKDKTYVAKEVVLTFDDAPNFPENTSQILDVLKKHQAKATFFCIGKYLKAYPELANRLALEQSMGNHTYSHVNLKASDFNITYNDEILKTQLLIDSLQPFNKHYFRPPFSNLYHYQKVALQKLGYQIFMWDLSAEEWDDKVTTQNILDYFHANLVASKTPTPIILFHLNKSTIEALDVLLTELKEKNIEVISLDNYLQR
jgi:peptidoglycan-N-acetylglucosamine deacetylase